MNCHTIAGWEAEPIASRLTITTVSLFLSGTHVGLMKE